MSKNRISELAAALNNENSDIRLDAVEALGDIEDDSAVNALAAAMKDRDDLVRHTAAISLGRIGSPAAVAALVDALVGPHQDNWLRAAAAEALVEADDPDAFEPLVNALRTSADRSVRAESVWPIGVLGGPRAVEPLIAALKDSDSGVRRLAAEQLGATADARAIDALTAAMNDADSDVQEAAAAALARIRGS
jgi:HEAT repeat protein